MIGRVATTLLHFAAVRAEEICGPHRVQVREAAAELDWQVVEADIDADQSAARTYGVMNVPAVAVQG